MIQWQYLKLFQVDFWGPNSVPSKTFLNDADKGVEGVLIKYATDANLRDNSKHFGDRIIQISP